jgi:hypothetical protein
LHLTAWWEKSQKHTIDINKAHDKHISFTVVAEVPPAGGQFTAQFKTGPHLA